METDPLNRPDVPPGCGTSQMAGFRGSYGKGLWFDRNYRCQKTMTSRGCVKVEVRERGVDSMTFSSLNVGMMIEIILSPPLSWREGTAQGQFAQ